MLPERACHHLPARRSRLSVLFGVTFAAVSACAPLALAKPAKPPGGGVPPKVGQPAPDFALSTRTGQTIRLSFLHSRPVIVCFFCNCGLCRAVAAELARTSEVRDGAQILVVASDPHVVLEDGFRRETGLDALYLNDSPPAVALRYASETCPRCWLVGTDGVVRYVNVDRLLPAGKLVAGLRAALTEAQPGRVRQEAKGPGERIVDRNTNYQRKVPRPAPAVPIPVGRGTLEVDARTFGVTLIADRRPITIESRDGRAPIATGHYDLLDWWAEMPDAEGRLWRARGGMRPFALTVTPDATVHLSLISPLQAQLVVTGRATELEFDIAFQGSGVDACRGVTVDGREPPRPRVEVRDGSGHVIADLECTYCCGFKASARWRPPADLRGALTAVPKVDLGPFQVAAPSVRFTLSGTGVEP